VDEKKEHGPPAIAGVRLSEKRALLTDLSRESWGGKSNENRGLSAFQPQRLTGAPTGNYKEAYIFGTSWGPYSLAVGLSGSLNSRIGGPARDRGGTSKFWAGEKTAPTSRRLIRDFQLG